ncbi:YopX protein [Streptococcus pneumoniae]|nr:phage protein [Streptococcus pneumoniae]VKC65386.1 YopX protein [Streptococcus pneumoniae]VPM63665.1 YopX protein [Streptococcus pneumoniae]VPN09769.1 YopX protein [Streptococcus pneumoniae]VTH68569.1 YopX protein [Streptococcus pneumoniae]
MFKDTFAITESGQVVVVEQESVASSPDYVFVDHLVIMQSTGLKDKNGKEVFVGDIIKCTRGCLHEVYIEKEYGGTYFGGMPAVYLKDLREGYAWTEHEEIIGNIYENPELLEVNE